MKRRLSVGATLALVAGVLAIGATISPASAGTAVNTNACINSATGTFTDVDITTEGLGAPNPATLGVDTITVSGATWAAFFDAAVLVAGYNLGLLTEGVNDIPAYLTYTINGTNTVEGSETFGDSGVDLVNNADPIGDPNPDGFDDEAIFIFGSTTITDPDGTPGTGDETATDLLVSTPVPDTVWTPASGGTADFSDGGAVITASLAGGLLAVNFTCSVGTSTPVGCVADPATDCTGFDPAAATPFDSVTVIAPPAPPVCNNGSLTVGLNQSASIDLNTLCSDQNNDIDPTTYTLVTPATNGTVTIDATGLATYDSTSDPGAGGDSFDFNVSDLGGNGASNTATVQVTVLANTCDATASPCSLSQIVFFTVTGDTMTFTQANDFCDTTGEVNGFDDPDGVPNSGDETPIVLPGAIGCQNVALSGVTLDGTPQIAEGSLNDLTVTNERGTAAGWAVTAYSTDYGIPGLAPEFDFDGPGPAPATPVCSVDAVALAAAVGAPAGTGEPDRNCISGNNMGYAPFAEIDHTQIPGDVATITSGAASAADAASWLAELACSGQDVDAGPVDGATDTSTGVLTCFNSGTNADGLVGYTGNPAIGAPQSLICSAATDQSGGTFGCDADLWLGVPASAGAGTYFGSIILTLT